jgi:uncharacterized membrane protein
MAMFSVSIDIAAPAERVYQVISDVEKWHEWTPSITSVKRLGDGPFAVGARALIHQPKLPPATWKVTEIVPGKSFTWVNSGPGYRVAGHHAAEPNGAGGTRATLAVEYRGLFGGLLARLTKETTERYIAMEAKGLKARSENPSYRTGAGEAA